MPPPKVALLIETSNAYARGLMRGVESYLREGHAWSIYLAEHTRGDRAPSWLEDWDGQGVIARIENKEIARALDRLEIPIVDVSAALLLPHLPACEIDDAAVARLALEHFLDRGFRTFAFCGDARFNWSRSREEEFTRLVRAAGHPCYTFTTPRNVVPDSDTTVETIGRWLRNLPKPVAVFSCYDLRGLQVLDACRRNGIPVPDEVAVLAVDNDDLLCDLAHPPLSSIIPNTRRTGYEAAALLDRMMAGEKVPGGFHLVPPLGIATRQSSDVLAVDDRQIAQAVRYIRENACRNAGVEEAARHAGLSRRLFEMRFKKIIGRTPNEEIVRVRLQRVKELLTETDLPLSEIAERAGFPHVEYLSVVFKKKTGLQPSKYRREHQPRRA